jgi:uncharacterized membrane protein
MDAEIPSDKNMRYLIAFLALVGVVVSGLALRVHYDTGTEPCSINAHWDCGVVNHSSYAEVAHVPVAILGILGYLALGGLGFYRQRYLFLLVAIVGLAFALRLSLIEELVLGVWCLYCVISQGIIVLMVLLGLGWFSWEYWTLRQQAKAQ